MKNEPREITRPDIKDPERLLAELKKTSKANPTCIVVADVIFCKAKIVVFEKQPTDECFATRFTYKLYGGFFKNGQLVQPTRRWMDRYEYVPVGDR